MNALLRNPVFRALSDLRLSAVLLLVLGVASGVGTFIESHYSGIANNEIGRAAAYDIIYDSLWFNALLVLLFVNLSLNLVRRWSRGRPSLGFLLVHIGMLVILLGAGITRWFGFEGYLHIREGEANNLVASAKSYAIVTEGQASGHVPVRLYDNGPQHLEKSVSLPGGAVKLGVEEFWTRFERRLVPGPGGEPVVTFGTIGEGGMNSRSFSPGDRDQLAGVTVTFHRQGLPSAGDPTDRYGAVRVRAGGEVCRLGVRPQPGPLGSCNGWTFAIEEFQSDFRVGGESDPEGPMLNPMVKLLVTSPAGKTAEKILFALHPDFGMVHEEADLLAQLDLVYEVSSGVDLAVQDGAIVMRAPFDVTVGDMGGGGESRRVPAGEVVPLESQRMYSGAGAFRVVTSQVELSMVERPSLSNNPGAPPAARLSVASGDQRAEAICLKDGPPQTVQLGDRTLSLEYGSIMRALPYELFLEDFVLETYPGSDNPASYESHVMLNDPEHGITGQPVRIWMNHPLNHRGSKHFQSSYDRDRRGTVLSVNKDPGKMPTYLGYIILSVGFAVIMARILVSRSRNQAATLALLLLALGLPVAPARAQTGQPAPASTQAPTMLTLPDDIREQAARLIVQDFRGRMKPLDTLARETAMKVTKKTSFEGRDPIDLFLDLAVHPSAWYSYPMISVKTPGVQDMLGISRDTHYVSIASLLDGGRYKLQDQVELAHRTPSVQRDKTTQKLILFDERVHILYSELQGSSLRLFPIPDDPGHTWEQLPEVLKILGDDPRAAEFQAAGDALFGGLESGNLAQVREGLRLTAALQSRYGSTVMPSDLRVSAELFLNSWFPFAKSTLPYMGAFVLLIIAYFWGLFRRDGKPWTWRSPLYALGMLAYLAGFGIHAYGFVMRWIASGRAPLSNGHESLLWVALTVALAGLVFELISRSGAAGALGSLLTAVVLGVAMMSAFDPAIGPLVPVLASYWLNIHVTIITASYGFLGLCCLLGGLTLVLLIIAGLSKKPVGAAVAKLDRLNVDVMIVGLGLLSVGTLLGGVWANESWGRYWGWDPKETWALVSILVYAMILHFRWIPALANVYVQAVGSFIGIWSIIMTYFGVNYLLVGLHSYAAGEATRIPGWVVVGFLVMLAVAIVAGFAWTEARPRLKVKPA
ncbi:MAG: cytochrome c biogenesis protein CcsA [Candidatus Krumholzibacteriia bacterium]